MDIMAFGVDYTTGGLLQQPIDEQKFSELILSSFPHEGLREETTFRARGKTFKTEVERRRFPDLANPKEVGWTFLVNDNDPAKDRIIDALQPLAEHRGMSDPGNPLLYTGQYEYEWWDWIRNNYWSLDTRETPYYVLIVGAPQQVPFRFQSLLDSTAAVGRVHFDSISALMRYVRKVIRLENAPAPVVAREALMFAPDWGVNDPTFFSKRFMAQPLSAHIKKTLQFTVKSLLGDDATKQNLVGSIDEKHPSLVYTASHGIGAPKEKPAVQRRYNGAICCQEMLQGGTLPPDGVYSADDVPDDVPNNKPYLEGSVFFEFSCFGYGTPAYSDFLHWTLQPSARGTARQKALNAREDFIAALPQSLLANPRGPIAFIGHVDTAWLHGFADPANPYILERWSSRIRPFKAAVEGLLGAQTVGLALNAMNKRFDVGNFFLTNAADRAQRGLRALTPEENAVIVEYWITRTDAQNYMLFGDPGTYVRIPTSHAPA